MNRLTFARLLPWLSVVWMLIASSLAVLDPLFAFVPDHDRLVWIPIGMTMGLIASNFVVSLKEMSWTGSALAALPLTLVQFFLFAVLFSQIGSHLGMEHYDVASVPAWWHWLQFTSIHAFRAADMFDTLQAYNLNVQTIQHNSSLTAGCVIALHLVVSIFILSLIVSAWQGFVAQRSRRSWLGLLNVRIVLVSLAPVWLSAWLATVLHFRPWALKDIPLWFGENIVRALDFPDVMEAFGIHWHQVPSDWWVGTLAFTLRLIVIVVVGMALNQVMLNVRVRYLGGLGLTPAELEQVLRDIRYPRKLRDRVRARLQRIWVGTGWSREEVWRDCAWLLMVGVVSGGVLLAALLPVRQGSIASLTSIAARSEGDRQRLALAALRRLGPEARSAVTPLVKVADQFPHDQRLVIWETLGHFGQPAAEPLGEVLLRDEEAEALVAIDGLAIIGPESAPFVVQALQSRHKSVRLRGESILLAFGSEAVGPLMLVATEQTFNLHLKWIRRLERNWYLRSTENPLFVAAIRIREPLEELLQITSSESPKKREIAIERIGNIGPAARQAKPVLIERLSDPEPTVVSAAMVALDQIDVDWTQRPEATEAVPDLVRMFDVFKGTPTQEESLVRVFSRFGPDARNGLPFLIPLLVHRNWGTRKAVASVLERVDSNWHLRSEVVDAVPEVGRKLFDKNPDVRMAALTVLEQFDSRARAALPGLVQMLADENAELRIRTSELLPRIHLNWFECSEAKQAVTGLVYRLMHQDEQVQFAAFDALRCVDSEWQGSPQAKRAVPKLVRALVDKEARPRALVALKYADPDWPNNPYVSEVIPEFVRKLSETYWFTRATAAEVLGQLRAKQAVSGLKSLLDDNDPEVREAAKTALMRIERSQAIEK